mmetsp:Transcript_18092/g.17456  ORF Transcript_18092/g.17456 Transcript_18092/m.17456 type:complete len:273 (-) Transcript_18092:157-975(-)|eukprot:CAMPEP_0197832302 /NCGR_PEP_ID=MMETSP1437-20131217/14164_1 /TAXON_ID=49252 ORGANISM="Eucampia antarctica, Strain CCMP1452" /NCGR_SAMPLE_ID=MMETSP1437 /ASSEMBLY_ACC=CAM_ASM_001096 /LENGTH=272 /DNA_ID=CAMNT_0043435611 /DNA_START=68 /DNA_END=886 /DNA_ORIENTATION=+
MSTRSSIVFLTRRVLAPAARINDVILSGNKKNSSFLKPSRFFSSAPESISRVGAATSFPNEYPGMNYEFNWSLNADGVTPTKKSAFRMTKPLDVRIAGLDPFKSSSSISSNGPLKVDAESAKASMPEAGSDALTFENFDEVTQRTKDLLSMSDHLYCPEGYVPGTRISVRVITNSKPLAPQLLAYLERAPKKDPSSQSITAYVLVDPTDQDFSAYAIEEIEQDGQAKSVAAVVVLGKAPSLETVVAGLEMSAIGLKEDEAARADTEEAAQEE